MSFNHEGEIILKEKHYGSRRRRYLVKPPEQGEVVVVDEGKYVDWFSWFSKLFLPHGYPHSVSKDYTAYQIWDTAQAFCSTITGTLATQEVLRGVGVGDSTATALAATITWVIKDGCGHVGRILFACTHGTQLDSYSKRWRLYADVLNDAAMCIEISLPLFKEFTTFVLCVSTTMKAIVGVAGGATRVALTQHHAVTGNLADVAAKDAAQETAVNLVASIAALVLIGFVGSSLFLFIVMLVLHISFNYLAVRAVCLRTMNESRYLQLIDAYLQREVILSPCDVNQHEPILFYHFKNNRLDYIISGFRINMGFSLKKVVIANPNLTYLKTVKNVYAKRNYLLYPDIGSRNMYVLLREEASTNDTLCAYFHATLLSLIICAINSEPLAIYEMKENARPFATVCHILQAADWSRDAVPTSQVGGSGFLYDPSEQLIIFLDEVVHKEWKRFRSGLQKMSWDLSKHLLLSDDWRVTTHTIDPEGKCLIEDDDGDTGPVTYILNDDFNPGPLNIDSEQMLRLEPDDDGMFTIDPESETYEDSEYKQKGTIRWSVDHLRKMRNAEGNESIGSKNSAEAEKIITIKSDEFKELSTFRTAPTNGVESLTEDNEPRAKDEYEVPKSEYKEPSSEYKVPSPASKEASEEHKEPAVEHTKHSKEHNEKEYKDLSAEARSENEKGKKSSTKKRTSKKVSSEDQEECCSERKKEKGKFPCCGSSKDKPKDD